MPIPTPRTHPRRGHPHRGHGISGKIAFLLALLVFLTGCQDLGFRLPPCPDRSAEPVHLVPSGEGEPGFRSTEVQGGWTEGGVEPWVSGTGWHLDEAVYRGECLDLSAETRHARDVDFSPDGSHLFVVARDRERVISYRLATPWVPDSGVATGYLELSAELNSRADHGARAHGIYLRKDDGRRLWIWNRTEIWEYTLDIPWELESARPTGYKSFEGTILRGHGIDFRPDGRRLFVDDRNLAAVFQFVLDEPWDVTSAVLETTLDISDQEKAVRGIQFRPDGERLFVMDTRRREILEYDLHHPWELRDARFIRALSVSGQTRNPRSITWSADGSRFFVTEVPRRLALVRRPALFSYEVVQTPTEAPAAPVPSVRRVPPEGVGEAVGPAPSP
ncbi:MAG: hypothetical protein EA422_11860 [Gemmatimonadales bacterium]|nr:MAG: hypothetical protein EA422_11860 [Gemmatimonadales bacterium]